ncbi:probable BOI-related E3 ubiquitin-protein ligase 3 [Rhodamnia argentea]|uniref:Probable BOI-related E3 ubiquitin-protein ligase 3 n=1 Tax=Rhodamnia argentea TaxID=178133 RepID=A0ABM3H4L7_9MYRT|nr:probable BOI-related E3 ubiquitin-protein ligase 3 [Rhodamnia argentea]
MAWLKQRSFGPNNQIWPAAAGTTTRSPAAASGGGSGGGGGGRAGRGVGDGAAAVRAAVPVRGVRAEPPGLPGVRFGGHGERARESVIRKPRNRSDSEITRHKMSLASPFLGHDVAFEIQRHQLEIDRLISQHTQMLMLEVEVRVKQQYEALLLSIHDSVARKLKEKDTEIRKIWKSNLLLQEKVKFLAAENQIWRGLAQTNEAAANSLRSDLEHALARGGGGVDDAESCCGSNDPGRAGADCGDAAAESGRGWRWCGAFGQRESRVVLLPCRHLCLCVACGPSHRDCPACGSGVTASVHANLSSSSSSS